MCQNTSAFVEMVNSGNVINVVDLQNYKVEVACPLRPRPATDSINYAHNDFCNIHQAKLGPF